MILALYIYGAGALFWLLILGVGHGSGEFDDDNLRAGLLLAPIYPLILIMAVGAMIGGRGARK